MRSLRKRDVLMNRIPPLVLEEARKIKDLPFERLIVFNYHCTEIVTTCNGTATGIPLSPYVKSQVYKKPTLHNHPLMETSCGSFTSAIPSIGDIIGAHHYLSPRLFVCDRDKITKTIMPKELNEKKLGRLQHWMYFGCSFEQSPLETIQEIRDVLSHIKLDFQLFDINTLQSRNDFVTLG